MIKTSKKLTAIILIICLLVFPCVGAWGITAESVQVQMNIDTNRISVQGVHPLGAGMQVTIYTTVGNSTVPFYKREITSGENGAFSFTYTMDLNQDLSGTYTVRVGGAGLDSITRAYLFINQQDSIKIVQNTNNVTSVDVMRTVIQDIADECGIDFNQGFSDLSLNGQVKVYEALLNRSYSTAFFVQRAFNQAVAIQTLNEASKEEGAALIAQYAQLLNLELGTDSKYADIQNESSKDVIYLALVGADLSPADVSGVTKEFNKAVYVALFNEVNTSNRNQFIEYITECNEAEYVAISLDDYHSSKLSDVDRVNIIKNVINAKDNSAFANLTDVKTEFNRAVSSMLSSIKSETGGGNGGKKTVSSSLSISQDAAIPTESPKPQPTTSSFVDLSDVAWAVESIEYMAGKKIVSGIGNSTFLPNLAVKREEFVKILMQALAIPKEETEKTFTDVSKDDWYYDYVMSAYASNIIKGIDYNVFGTGTPITREQLCSIVYRAMNLMNINIEDSEKTMNFTDQNQISDYALEAVTCLYRAGIINGVDEAHFDPKGEATRAMAVKIIYQLMERGNLL